MPVLHLTREVRFSIDRDWVRGAHGAEGFGAAMPITNSFGGWPSAVGIAPYLVLRATLSGPPDPVTGYLVNIRHIDALLREHALPLAAQQLSHSGVLVTGERLLAAIWHQVLPAAPREGLLTRLELRTTPYLRFAMTPENEQMVELTQTFEFSASHRLHVPAFSDEKNRAVFGKCNNPRGHGHNYVLEVTVAGRPDDTGCVLPLPVFEAIVQREVIDRLDHKHLNEDTAEFASLNPSVENIARVAWDRLKSHMQPARLAAVRVWETPKTSAEYRGEAD